MKDFLEDFLWGIVGFLIMHPVGQAIAGATFLLIIYKIVVYSIQ